jgi:hypothetical protein
MFQSIPQIQNSFHPLYTFTDVQYGSSVYQSKCNPEYIIIHVTCNISYLFYIFIYYAYYSNEYNFYLIHSFLYSIIFYLELI